MDTDIHNMPEKGFCERKSCLTKSFDLSELANNCVNEGCWVDIECLNFENEL